MLSPTAVPVLAAVAFVLVLAVLAAIGAMLLREPPVWPVLPPTTGGRHKLRQAYVMIDLPDEPRSEPEPAPEPVVALCPLDPDWDWRAAAALMEDTELVAA